MGRSGDGRSKVGREGEVETVMVVEKVGSGGGWNSYASGWTGHCFQE